MSTAPEPLRFTDVLTNASAVANYLGAPDVTAAHLLDALAILSGEQTVEVLGRPRSMFGRGHSSPGATEGVRAFAQRWFARLGSDTAASLAGDDLRAFEAELRDLAAAEQSLPGA
jgi:hypothetical protein